MRPASAGEGTAFPSASKAPSWPWAAHVAFAAAASSIQRWSSSESPCGVRFAPTLVSVSTCGVQSRARRSPRMAPSENPSTWHCQTPRRIMTSRVSAAMSS